MLLGMRLVALCLVIVGGESVRSCADLAEPGCRCSDGVAVCSLPLLRLSLPRLLPLLATFRVSILSAFPSPTLSIHLSRPSLAFQATRRRPANPAPALAGLHLQLLKPTQQHLSTAHVHLEPQARPSFCSHCSQFQPSWSWIASVVRLLFGVVARLGRSGQLAQRALALRLARRRGAAPAPRPAPSHQGPLAHRARRPRSPQTSSRHRSGPGLRHRETQSSLSSPSRPSGSGGEQGLYSLRRGVGS